MSEFDDDDDDLISAVSLNGLDHAKGCDAAGDARTIDDVTLPESFPFPFTPYDIQIGFMKAVYQCLELGKIGIFESPTGTGKSLSLLCSALQWLQDFEKKQEEDLEQINNTSTDTKTDTNDELSWVTEYEQKMESAGEVKALKEKTERRLKTEARYKEMRNNKYMRNKRKRDKLESDFDDLMKGASKEIQDAIKADKAVTEANNDDCDDDIVVDDYVSDEESKKGDEEDEMEGDEDYVTKIYFCSRTHSQLSQFVREVQKSPFGEQTRVVSLASRQNMCVNEAVKRLKSLSLINDTCLDLQKNKNKSVKSEDGKRRKTGTGGCPFYKQETMMDFSDRILIDTQDIEELVTTGKQMKACPYYGARFAVPAAQLIALPYNTLLHSSTRRACGIKLKGNIVVIDEAHNLLETVNNIHSVEVNGAQITRAHSQLTQYLERYKSRLKAKNLLYIRQLLFILANCLTVLGGKVGQAADEQIIKDVGSRLWTINAFLFQSKLDNMNLFKVKKYCERSQISKKLHGFVEKYQPPLVPTAVEKKDPLLGHTGVQKFLQGLKEPVKPEKSPPEAEVKVLEQEDKDYVVMRSPLIQIEGFLEALTSQDKDGRVVINKAGVLSKSSLKFLLLNPAVHFAEIIKEARAVIVAGGTMQPVSDFKDQLFHAAGVTPDQIIEYSCGHVIPPGNLLAISLGTGPMGVQLDFTYGSRNDPKLLDELGQIVTNLGKVVPGGIVMFFPSYEYEKLVYAHWEKSGTLARISAKKKIFREPKRSGGVDQILQEYSGHIQKCKESRGESSTQTGAVLLCIVGGKMSEGINFSDDLGRCVVMVGLPYPNINSPELKEKMNYLNSNYRRAPDGKLPGQVHYENLCMKAVNQSIGRAIRHLNDYATIVLVDHRYGRGTVLTKLPTWIQSQLQKHERFGPAFAAVSKFCAAKKNL